MKVKADHCPTRQGVPKPPTVSEMKPISLSEVMNGCCDTQGIFQWGKKGRGTFPLKWLKCILKNSFVPIC